MNKIEIIDIKIWKEFQIKEIFKITRGKRLIEADRLIGDIPYYSASEYNNGITDFISNPLFTEKKSLIYSTFGNCYYVEEEFTASDEISILKNDKLNKFNALFVATIINKKKYKFVFGRKAFKNKFENEIIKLPTIKINGNYEPDWEFMEKYIEKLEKEQRKLLSKMKSYFNLNKQKDKIEIKEWKNFKLEEIFSQIYKAKSHIKQQIETSNEKNENSVNFITRTEKNNGCDSFVSLNSIIKLEEGNALIIGDTTSTVFYQEEKFATGDHIVVCRAKLLNKHNALFLKTIIEKERYKYSYGRAFKIDLIKNTIIKLPAKLNNKNKYEPNWEYMENYIKSFFRKSI
jgi:putative type II site-specific deoxyribonuclease